ncbi:right-handed parallel beta-helix repeat-containing protein [Prosthecobacter fusiformis]|uniref:right-handed parallel beta-helix repeat-containing protein n=1 Tax=Prosthecobacter fusiformis TaxID=48464 RepID=UPI001414D274|nr:right-handed parallel beta-helix repeat-containing protein [Prosthecobacter fusiformis]
MSVSPALAEVVISVGSSEAVKTPLEAVQKVRELRAGGEKGTVRVEFSSGEFFLAEPLKLEAADSGLEMGPTIYQAAKDAKVTFTGGKKVAGWKEAKDGLWQAKVEGKFEQMWINGRRAVRARTPNAMDNRPGAVGGYFNAKSQASTDMFKDLKKPSHEAFVARPADYALLKALTADERADVLLTVMQTWTVGQCRIQEMNDAANGIRIVGTALYPFVQFEPDQRWYVENFRAALDAPGEWFLTRDGDLLYKPLPGEDMTKVEVVVPVTEKLLLMDGVQHVSFEGITFAHTQFQYGPAGHHDRQAAAGTGAAIEVDRSQHIRFHDCEFKHISNYALWFRTACALSSVTHSYLHDLGSGGVRIGDTKMPDDATLTHHIVVDDCIIHGGGRLFPSACGIFLAHAADCEVTHCDIGDLYYTGISAGWVWGYKHSPAKRNRLDFNHIHHLGWGVLSDMGGFYGLGRSEGTTVSHNHVHDVGSYRYGGWGLYTDEGSTGVTMMHNVVHDTSESTFHQHYGKWNQVSHNVFAYGRKAQIQRSRPETHASFAYENNVVIYEGEKLLDGSNYNWGPGTYEMRNNVYWNSAGLPVMFHDTDLAGWQAKGHDEGSIVADPLFVDAAKRNFRLKKESPALKMGFIPGDANKAGVLGDGDWRKLATALSFPDFWEKSKPWPMPAYEVDETFEHMGLSFPILPRQEIHWQNKGDSVYVVDDQAASGKRSLKITDAPGLDPSWDPHLVLKPGYQSGKVTVAFQVRTEKGSKFFVECRGPGSAYQTGPSVAFDSGYILEKRSKTKLALPPDTWAKIEMTATLGAENKGQWTLKVTLPGQPVQEFANLPCDAEWNELAWLGFVSSAKEKVAFWLDDLKVKVE